ncbi:HAD family hydrolase [Alicyclobacillus curvatus]|jgi:D-glycero-D-manno-heptose 1,7-bisphosphate phosphatase|nr:HAD family hydrolase [Alicyclobacillus curvatus]
MKRAVVLDRDGVINDNSRPVNLPDELILFPDAASSIARLNQAGFLVCVATNQGGVGLGYLSQEGLDQIHDAMLRRLAEHGATIQRIAACTHAPHAGCSCRKPRPGMLLDLHRQLGFSLDDSFMVGDRETDVEAGIAAGMKTAFIGAGKTTAEFQATSLTGVVDWILGEQTPSTRQNIR